MRDEDDPRPKQDPPEPADNAKRAHDAAESETERDDDHEDTEEITPPFEPGEAYDPEEP